MAVTAAELNDNDILYGYLPEYLDGELPNSIAAKYEQLLQTAGKDTVLEDFQSLRGRLQLSMQSYYLRDKEQSELAALVQDPRVKATVENVKIAELERGVAVSTMVRRVGMVIFVIALVIVAYWQFGKASDNSFKPLEYLGYEALALEEASRERLNLPSHDLKEVSQYLTSYPGLDFKPRMLKNVPSSWELEGATVIDYEVAKVVVVMYDHRTSKNNEKIIHFSFAGRLSDLPRSEPGNMRGLIYQTYASNDQNMIAWQSAPNVVSMLVGRRSADELAEIAVAGHNN